MAVNQSRADESLLDQELLTVDDLLSDERIRRITPSGSGSLQTTLPPNSAPHIGLTEGTGAKISMHDGRGVALVDEAALIIQPHPAWED